MFYDDLFIIGRATLGSICQPSVPYARHRLAPRHADVTNFNVSDLAWAVKYWRLARIL